jgi:hypothetical protein
MRSIVSFSWGNQKQRQNLGIVLCILHVIALPWDANPRES